MKFLADMGIATHTVHFLRSMGYDAVHLREEGLQRIGDDLVIGKAVQEGRIILTHDLDFSRLVALGGSVLPSVITFRLQDMRPESVERSLLECLDRLEEQLEKGALVSVTDRSIRARSLSADRSE